jgi:protein O-mannosyl-transferase
MNKAARDQIVLLLFFVLAACALQYPGLHAPMYYDSTFLLLEHPTTFSWGDFQEVVKLEPRRLIPMLTFYVNLVLGGTNPLYFRILSIVILAATSLMVTLIMSLLLSVSGAENELTSIERKSISVFLGVLYLVHPVQTYVTLYIWQRIALLGCFFYFSAFAAYVATRMHGVGVRGDEKSAKNPNGVRLPDKLGKSAIGYGLCLFLYFCGMLSKESTVLLPAMLMLVEIAFFKESWGKAAARGLAFLLVTLLMIEIRSVIGHSGLEDTTGRAGIFDVVRTYYEMSGLSPIQVALTQCRVVFRYLSIIFIPLPSWVQLVSPQVVSHSLLDPWQTVVAVLGVVGLMILALSLFRKRPLSGLGVIFFLGNLVPDGIVVARHAFFGYRPVLPMLGILMVMADCAWWMLVRLREKAWSRSCLVATTCAMVAAVGYCTFERATIWSNPAAFWMNTVKNFPGADDRIERPGACQALLYLGAELEGRGRGAEAIPYLERVLKILPNDSYALGALGRANAGIGNYPEAETFFRRALKARPDLVDAYIQLGNVLAKQGKLTEAVECYKKGMQSVPRSVKLRVALGKLLIQSHKHAEAVENLRQAVELDGRFYESHYYLGKAFLGLGATEPALKSLSKAAELRGDIPELYNDLGVAYGRSGMTENALASFRKALELNPDDEAAARNLNATLQLMRNHTRP